MYICTHRNGRRILVTTLSDVPSVIMPVKIKNGFAQPNRKKVMLQNFGLFRFCKNVTEKYVAKFFSSAVKYMLQK